MPPAETLLVLELRATDGLEAEAAAVTTVVAGLISERGELQVISASEAEALGAQVSARQLLDCDDPGCASELSRLAETRLVLSGSLGRVGSKRVVALSLTDAAKGQRIGSAEQVCQTFDDIIAALPGMLSQVFGWAQAPAPERRYRLPTNATISLAVFDLEPKGIGEAVAQNLTQVLAVSIKRIEGTRVISRSDIASILDLQGTKMRIECEDQTECLAELGGALGVEKLVVGFVGRIGGSFVISLRLIDVGATVVDNRVTEIFAGIEDQLIYAVRQAGRRLLGVDEGEPGALAIAGSEPGAEVVLDEHHLGELPLPAIPNLASGRHSVRVAKEGFVDWRSDFFVEAAGTTPLWAELERVPAPWCARWWLWAIVGGVAAAATTVAVVLALPPPQTGNGMATFD